jgi:hypothetical protein
MCRSVERPEMIERAGIIHRDAPRLIMVLETATNVRQPEFDQAAVGPVARTP